MNCDVPALWQQHKEMLRKYILKRANDEQLADDVLQDVLLKVYNFCMTRSGVKNERSWLFQITHNTLMDHFKKNSKYTSLKENYDIENEDLSGAGEEAASIILPMINLLPEEYALPLKLSDIDGMKQKDIADQIGLSYSATKTRISRAREKLKDLYLECTNFELDQSGRFVDFEIKSTCAPLQHLTTKDFAIKPSGGVSDNNCNRC